MEKFLKDLNHFTGTIITVFTIDYFFTGILLSSNKDLITILTNYCINKNILNENIILGNITIIPTCNIIAINYNFI